MWDPIKKITILSRVIIWAGPVICLLIAGGTASADHINFGDIQQVVNNYPPGKIIFNGEVFPHEPFSDKEGIDIRPLFCPDSENPTYNFCENEWHVLALRIDSPVFIPSFGSLDSNKICGDTNVEFNDCEECLCETIGFIPSSSPREAIHFLNQLGAEFCFDNRPQEALCLPEGGEPEPEEDFCLNGIRFEADRTAVKRFIPQEKMEELEGLRDFCGCDARVQDYAIQFYQIVQPFDPRLSPGLHTFESYLPYFDFFAFRTWGIFTVLSQDAPECSN